MENHNPPRAGEVSAMCPNPELIARTRKHFGRDVWHFDCAQAVEVLAKESGILIKCSGLNGFCCVDDGNDFFVGSPDVNSLKVFLETTLSYLGLK
jgi:hypothetical protein